jgi:hypothetical protein
VVAAVVLVAFPPTRAQSTVFNPSVSVGAWRTNNVSYLGQPGVGTGDTVSSISLLLPLLLQQDRGAVRLDYRTGWFQYQEQRQFNSNEQDLLLGFDRTTRRRATWRIFCNYVRSDEQQASPLLPSQIPPGPSDPPDEVGLSLTGRVRRETLDAIVTYEWKAGRKWDLGVTLDARSAAFDGAAEVEDRIWYGPTITARENVSRRASWGINYSFRHAELDLSGDEDFHAVDLFWSYDLNARMVIGLRFGAFSRQPDIGEAENRAFGGIELQFNEGLTLGPLRFGFNLGTTPSSGGALTGTAADSTAGVFVSGVRTYPVNWRVQAFYNVRQPFDSTQPTTDTLNLRAAAEVAISRIVGLRFAAELAEQASESEERDGTYTRAGLTIAIYPLGGTRIAGRYQQSPL